MRLGLPLHLDVHSTLMATIPTLEAVASRQGEPRLDLTYGAEQCWIAQCIQSWHLEQPWMQLHLLALSAAPDPMTQWWKQHAGQGAFDTPLRAQLLQLWRHEFKASWQPQPRHLFLNCAIIDHNDPVLEHLEQSLKTHTIPMAFAPKDWIELSG